MSAITGDVTTYLEILGLAPDAAQVAAFVDAFDVEVEEDEIDLDGEQETYLILADAGVDLNFTDGELTAIFVSCTATTSTSRSARRTHSSTASTSARTATASARCSAAPHAKPAATTCSRSATASCTSSTSMAARG